MFKNKTNQQKRCTWFEDNFQQYQDKVTQPVFTSNYSIALPFLFTREWQHLDSRCVLLSDPGTFVVLGVPTKTRLESSIKTFKPLFFFFFSRRLNQDGAATSGRKEEVVRRGG